MNTGTEKWLTRGKEARLHNEPRDLIDGRMTVDNRRAFQAGWDEQDRAMAPRSAAEINESNSVLDRLKAWSREMLGRPETRNPESSPSRHLDVVGTTGCKASTETTDAH